LPGKGKKVRSRINSEKKKLHQGGAGTIIENASRENSRNQVAKSGGKHPHAKPAQVVLHFGRIQSGTGIHGGADQGMGIDRLPGHGQKYAEQKHNLEI